MSDMTHGSARQLRKLINAKLRNTGTLSESAVESSTEGGSLSRDVVEASVSALDEQLVKRAGSRSRMTEDDKNIVNLGRDATQKLLNEGSGASLTPEEEMALEAIAIADGSRPALLIQNDSIDPTDAKAAEWADELRDYEAAIRTIAPSVGRIDSNGRHIGTGWIIRPGYLVTNRHVAQLLSKERAAQHLVLDPLSKPTICFGCEAREATPRPRYTIKKILFSGAEYIDPQATSLARLDLAVLRLDPRDIEKLPPALPSVMIAAAEIAPGRDLYALGYPGPTSRSSLPQKTLLRLFGEDVSVKRLSPGEIDVGLGGIKGDTAKRTLTHDATTLGGSSGSAILGFDDLGNPKLVGLHFGGYEVRYGPMGEVEFRGRNYAHCFAAMADVMRTVDAAIGADRKG
jgi:serine protease